MIAMLEGKVVVVDLSDNFIFLKVSRGITYQIYTITPLIERLANYKESIEDLVLYTVPVYKENEATLYGFETLEERKMFEKLISVKGVGPSIAMTILSNMEYNELAEALMAKNIEKFKTIKGIGETIAQNIIKIK